LYLKTRVGDWEEQILSKLRSLRCDKYGKFSGGKRLVWAERHFPNLLKEFRELYVGRKK
jgi:hypothetical protein